MRRRAIGLRADQTDSTIGGDAHGYRLSRLASQYSGVTLVRT